MATTRKITYTALGIALYVCLSMTLKIPVIGHVGLDLGYIALAVCCANLGPASGAVVGAAGCSVVSLLTSGWFPPGWALGNAVIGLICGGFYGGRRKRGLFTQIAVSVLAVFIGIVCIKSFVECVMFQIPLLIKLPKSITAFVMDSITMICGLVFHERLESVFKS